MCLLMSSEAHAIRLRTGNVNFLIAAAPPKQ